MAQFTVRPSLRDRVDGGLLVQHEFLDNARQHVCHRHEVFQKDPVFPSPRRAVEKAAQAQARLCFHPIREGGPETRIGTELRPKQGIFRKSLRDFSKDLLRGSVSTGTDAAPRYLFRQIRESPSH